MKEEQIGAGTARPDKERIHAGDKRKGQAPVNRNNGQDNGRIDMNNGQREKRITLVDYRPEYAMYFERFNKEWIEEAYELEPDDHYVLEHPEEAILQQGGRILFAAYEGNIIGAVALRKREPGLFELAKMAVGKSWRGLGAGRLLCSGAIAEAAGMQAHTVILYSNTRQERAIQLYRKLGFTELPLEPGAYCRANIKMGIFLLNREPGAVLIQ